MAHSRNILLVDDDTILLDLLTAHLQQHGFSVSTAGDGEEALRLLSTRAFTTVITDLHMPGIDGLSLSAIVKKSPHEIQVIMITGDTRPAVQAKARKVGIDALFTKPLPMPELLAAILSATKQESTLAAPAGRREFSAVPTWRKPGELT